MNYKILISFFACVISFPAFSAHSFAVMKYNEVQPGKSSKDEVSAILGEPKQEIDKLTYKYKSSVNNTDKIVIEYKLISSKPIVDKIDVYFSKSVPKGAFVKAMNLPEKPDIEDNSPDGKLQEFYGSTKSLVLTFKGKTDKSGVKIISYLSTDKFRSLADNIKGIKNSRLNTASRKKDKKGGNKPAASSKTEKDKVVKNTKERKKTENNSKSDRKEVAKLSSEAKQHMQQGMTYVSLAKANPKTKNENYNNALLEFSKAIEIYPNYAAAYSDRGVVYMQQKKYNKAEIDLKKAAELDPKDPYILYNLAALHSLQKQIDLSVEALDKALYNGFSNFDALRPHGKESDPDLKNLRESPEFKKTLEKHKVFILD